jgi:EAL domain-containing protein (putative c-di-GMP-specific phosphodiesterase class I)/AmiR/NasT family two-component response regulator
MQISNKRFLVIEDDNTTRALIGLYLKGLGANHITIVDNGQIAIEILAQENANFDVVICDLRMPVMDGVQFLRHVAQLEFLGAIILLSAADKNILQSAYQLAQSYNLNVIGSVSKPINPSALEKILKTLGTVQKDLHKKLVESITEEELHKGINGQELKYVFQPKIKVTTGEISGVEVLTRWNHPVRGILGPMAYIELAQRLGLVSDLTREILKHATSQTKAWMGQESNFKTAINVSADSLKEHDFADYVITTAKEHGVKPDNIIIEVTESQLVQDIKSTIENLTRLRINNIGVSIDDFGTGYSTLKQLKQIPFTELKIDRMFVSDATNDFSARAILESTIELAKKLQLQTVAEGVETNEDWKLVEELGCDYAQGYYFAMPMSVNKFKAWAINWPEVSGELLV